MPNAIAEHVASSISEPYDRENLRQYDVSQARRKHLSAVREFLAVKPFGDDGKALMRQTFAEAALTKEDVIDIINIGIETLVRHRYELPAFDTLLREARAERIATNQALQAQIHDALGDAGRIFLDKLFVVGDDPRRVSPWNNIKQDAAKPTIDGMRDLVERYDLLTELACHAYLLKTIPVIKIKQWALEGNSLDAASMVDMAAAKRCTVALALIRQRLAQVTDDLCNIFCKQMKRALHSAEEALEKYLAENQEKTDEILRRFAILETLLNSTQSADEQLKGIHQTVTARPDLCEFSRLHAEYGGKNEFRFVWQFFKPRRAEMLRILSKLKLESTSQDASFERSLVFMLENSQRQSEWLALKGKGKIALTADNLVWIPQKWWKLVTGEVKRDTVPTRINRRQFEACVCLQMVGELKSGDLCVIGSDAYSDYRNELVPMEKCERTRADYGEKVGLPVESTAFIRHIRTMLTRLIKTILISRSLMAGRSLSAKRKKRNRPDSSNWMARYGANSMAWAFRCWTCLPTPCNGLGGASISAH